MPLYQDESVGLSTRDRTTQPPDLLARSGLPVPEWKAELVPQFNADFRRLIARISSLFALIAPTAQGAPESADSLALVAHAPQHQNGGGDEVSILTLAASGLTAGHVMRATGPSLYAFGQLQVADLPLNARMRSLVYELRGTELAPGKKSALYVPYNAQITRWTLLADSVTNLSIDVIKGTVAGFPSSTSITGGGNEPELVAQAAASQVPVAWGTVDVNAGDLVGYHVITAPGGVNLAVLSLDLVQV